MNEAGSIEDVEKIRPLVGESTQLMTCLAAWNNQDPSEIVPKAREKNIGLYGFTKPQRGPCCLLFPIICLSRWMSLRVMTGISLT